MSTYNIIAASNESTVVAEYTPESARSDSFQSEVALEKEFIRLLTTQGYEYLTIHDENSLIANLRRQLELLNDYPFTDSEWKRFFTEVLANANEGIVEKSRTIQTDHVKVLRRDDGTSKNIQLIDKKNVHSNRLQVINQYEENEGNHDTRYDVTILVNGLPLVHVELKRRGVAIREAFNQIKRYQRDSFWAASGLYEYVQIFIISNGTHTKYYSNTTRNSHIKEMGESAKQKSKKTSNSFEFTSFWADGNNILNASRLQMQMEDVPVTTFSLAECVSELCEPYRLIAETNGLRFQIEIIEDMSVRLPENQLKKALSNILSNAVNYTEAERHIKVKLEKSVLSIQNECVPLSPDELQHIFEPFYRPNRAHNPANGGNGLGLYIVKTILDKQGLQYCFTSMKSKTGMEFVIYF